MLATTYTPALASWALITIYLVYLTIRLFLTNQRLFSLFIVSVFMISIVFGATSILNRGDIHMTKGKQFINSTIVTKVTTALDYYFLKDTDMYDHHLPMLGYVMFLPVVLYLTAALLFYFGGKHTVIALWIITTAIISDIAKGYANPPAGLAIHRAIVTFPIIVVGIVSILLSKHFRLSKQLFSIIFLIIIAYDFYVVMFIYTQAQILFDPRAMVIRETLKTAQKYGIQTDLPIQIRITTQNPQFEFHPDHLPYFFPLATLSYQQNSCLDNFDFYQAGISFTIPKNVKRRSQKATHNFMWKNLYFIPKQKTVLCGKRYTGFPLFNPCIFNYLLFVFFFIR